MAALKGVSKVLKIVYRTLIICFHDENKNLFIPGAVFSQGFSIVHDFIGGFD